MYSDNADKRTALAKMLRSEDETNRSKMRTREQILYGGNALVKGNAEVTGVGASFLSLKLRALVAFLLLIGFIAWDNGYYPIPAKYQEQLYERIADNSLGGNVFAFIEDIPYTLESK